MSGFTSLSNSLYGCLFQVSPRYPIHYMLAHVRVHARINLICYNVSYMWIKLTNGLKQNIYIFPLLSAYILRKLNGPVEANISRFKPSI